MTFVRRFHRIIGFWIRIGLTEGSALFSLIASSRYNTATSLEQLRGLAENKQYREVGNLLTGIVDMLSRFQEYHGIDRIKELTWKLNNLKADLKKMAFFEFD
jgi:hypothetical protein